MTDYPLIEKRVLAELTEKLPSHLTYHCTDHTKYVLERSIYIAEKEGVNGKDLLLLKIAALYHDYGFVRSHINHEEASCEFAKKYLKKDGFDKESIDRICEMIMATKIPQNPQSREAEILADADLEYLGTKRFEKISERLFIELQHFNPKLTRREWNNIQIKFLSSHSYHTDFCRQYKEKYKRKHLHELIEEAQ